MLSFINSLCVGVMNACLLCIVSNVVMRHDIKDSMDTVSEAYPHLVFHQFDSKLGARVQNILKYLFPVPKLDTQRVMTFANQNDFISFRYGFLALKDCMLLLVE